MSSNLLDSFVEVELKSQDDFLKVKETLTRIGIASRKTQTLCQSCHILHKKGKYYILHFKELFALDGKPTDFSESDLARRNAIVKLLSDWGLIIVKNPSSIAAPMAAPSQIKILSYKEKDKWTLVTKYSVGRRKVA